MATGATTIEGLDPVREGEGDPLARYRLVGNAFSLIVVLASLWELWRNFAHPSDRDFLGVWSAAQLALAGRSSAAYDNGLLHAAEASAATFGSAAAQLPFPYPPAYIALAAPFGLMSFPFAMAVWTLGTFAFYLFAARRLLPTSGWLAAAFPAVFANAAIGQNGFLTAGLFMIGLSVLSASPFAAGMVLGCLVIKPQLAMLLPVALVAGRQRRVVAGAALSSAGIMLFGLVAFGTATTLAWLHEVPLIVNVTSDGLMGWPKLASVYAAGSQEGLVPGVAIALHNIVALAAAAIVWRVWRSMADNGLKVATLAAGSMLMSPYVFYYDGLILVPAFFLLARDARSRGVLLALWCLSLFVLAQAAGTATFVNLNAVIPIGLLAVACHHARLARSMTLNVSATLRGKNFSTGRALGFGQPADWTSQAGGWNRP
jgi:Glycosyltransferase family 87